MSDNNLPPWTALPEKSFSLHSRRLHYISTKNIGTEDNPNEVLEYVAWVRLFGIHIVPWDLYTSSTKPVNNIPGPLSDQYANFTTVFYGSTPTSNEPDFWQYWKHCSAHFRFAFNPNSNFDENQRVTLFIQFGFPAGVSKKFQIFQGVTELKTFEFGVNDESQYWSVEFPCSGCVQGVSGLNEVDIFIRPLTVPVAFRDITGFILY